MHLFNSQLAAATGARHVETLDELNSFGAGAAADVSDFSAALFRVLRASAPWERFGSSVAFIRDRYAKTVRRILKRLGDLADNGYDRAADAVARYFPVDRLVLIDVREDRERSRVNVVNRHVLDSIKTQKEPAVRNLSRTRRRALFRSEAMPDLSREEVSRIVYGADAEATLRRIASQAKFSDPVQIAQRVVDVYARGGTKRDLARELRPVLGNNRAAAHRVARTEGARVVNTAAFQAFERLGDLIAGYQIHAKLDERTRPEHRLRNGRIYYRNPRPGQYDVRNMPHPPIEEDGTIAHYCRCWLSPVMMDVPKNSAAMNFRNDDDEIVPSPVVYDSWFRDATERQKRSAVGSKRFAVISDRYPGRTPDYYDFVSLDGGLLTTKYLENESETRRLTRRNSLIRIFSQHRQDKIAVLRTGRAAR